MNAFLSVFSDPATVDGWNSPGSFWDQENVMYWFNYEQDPERTNDWENIYTTISASDPAFAAQRIAMDKAIDDWWGTSNATEDQRLAVYNTTLPIYKKMIAIDQNEYRLEASSQFPDDFGDKTILAGGRYPTYKVALPSGVSSPVIGGQGVWSPTGGLGSSTGQTLTVLNSNGVEYVEFDFGSTYIQGNPVTVYMYVTDDNGYRHFKSFKITIQ